MLTVTGWNCIQDRLKPRIACLKQKTEGINATALLSVKFKVKRKGTPLWVHTA